MDEFLKCIRPYWRPHHGQEAFLRTDARIKVLACGRRWGKTDACAIELLASILEENPTRHLIVAPILAQATLLFERILVLAAKVWPDATLNVKRTPHPSCTIQLELGLPVHRIQARSGHLGFVLRGDEATHVIVDEAAFVPESLITEIVMPMLATTNGRLTLISTPKGKNHFWKFYRMGTRGEHGVWSRTAPSAESPYIHPEFLETQRSLISDRAFRVEYEAEFCDNAGTVFKSESIERCLVSRFRSDPVSPFWIGIDWARYHDSTAVAVLCGDRGSASLLRLETLPSVSWNDQVDRVAELVQEYPGARVLCDGTVIGDPAVEMLQARLPSSRIDGLVFNQKVKHQLIDQLASLIDRAALQMLPHPDLLREFEHYEATESSSGAIKLGAKSGFHDDRVTALALACRLLPSPYDAKVILGNPRKFYKSKPKTPCQKSKIFSESFHANQSK
jgi:hypothetical protein